MKNNGYILTFWLFFWNRFIKNSVVYRILCGVYSYISTKWKESAITNIFRKVFFSEEAVRKSVVGKLCFLPLILVEWIQKKSGTKITSQTENSFIVRSCKYYLHNLLAFNLRFVGTLLLSAATSSFIVSVIMGTGIKLELAGIILGAFLMLFDINATDFLKDSLVSKLIEKALDTDLSFDFYYITKCGGLKSIICAVVFGTITGLISGFASPLLAILFAGGLWFFFMVLYKVEFGVFVTLFLAPIVPTMMVVALCLLCLFSLFVRAFTTKKFEFKTEGVGLVIILMLGIYFLATLTSFAPLKGVQIWAVYFAFMVFYFVVINTIKTKKQLMNLLTVFALSGFAVCLYGILQYIFGWNVTQAWIDEEMFEDIKMRVYSTLENPNVLGEYILLVLPVTIALMWKKKTVFSKIVYGGMAGVMGIALILTFSRGCWIGVIVSAAIFITFVAGKLWGLMLLALPIIPMVLPESIINRFASIGDMKDSSTSYRVYIWMGTIHMLKDFWVSGIGPGTEAFTQVYPFYSYSSIVAPHSHNLFLQIMVESGILGIVAFAVLMFVFFKKLMVGYQVQGKFGEISVMLVGIGSAVMGFLVQGLFDNCFYNYRVFMIFWSVIAIGVAAYNIANNEKTELEVKADA
ncbi:MAG: O-antigen ligase family protein [Clostridia bacterium]|nr:O-antigen ligase family protein [Clostridia bacterium]